MRQNKFMPNSHAGIFLRLHRTFSFHNLSWPNFISADAGDSIELLKRQFTDKDISMANFDKEFERNRASLKNFELCKYEEKKL